MRHGQIPAAANRWLRGALVRAVVSHMQHAPDSWLARYYLAQKARLGWPTARVAAARKLARVIHAMLAHEFAAGRMTRFGVSSKSRMPRRRP